VSELPREHSPGALGRNTDLSMSRTLCPARARGCGEKMFSCPVDICAKLDQFLVIFLRKHLISFSSVEIIVAGIQDLQSRF